MNYSDRKTAVITGGNSGIGLALAKKLLSENYQVIITSRSGTLSGFYHSDLIVFKLDVTDKSSITSAAAEINHAVKYVDLLINNAGIATDAYFIKPEYESFTQTVAVNITGLVFFAEAMLDQIAEGGHIINISTDMSLLSEAKSNGPAYRMSKAAINMYTKMLSQRLTEKNIRVTAVHPGWVKTRIGGENAPMDTQWSAEGLYKVIQDTARTGEFRNIANDDRFLL